MKYAKPGEAHRLEITRSIRYAYHGYLVLANQMLQPLGLTATQCEILLYLYHQPSTPVEVGALLQFLEISSPSLSNTLKELRQQGYIRFSRQGDQRKKQVSLTVKALEIQSELTAAVQQREALYFQAVTDPEYTSMRDTLKKITANIKAQTGMK